MKIKVRKIMKVKTSSHCETVVTSSFRACSFAMDDGGRCLADVINDPLLLQSFLESGSDDNSKDPQDGTSSESAVESPQVSRTVHTSLSNHVSAEHIVESSEPMGYIYTVDNQGTFAVEPRVSSQSGVCSSTAGLGGVSLVVASSSVGPQTYQHASSSGATIHHLPSSAAHAFNPHSPASARPATPLSTHNIKSPVQGPSSVHSMPPPSPLQQTRSPLPSHTPSPAPAWSPAPPVLSPATSRTQPSMPSIAFQQSHNQILQTTCNVTQFVTAIATPQAITQKLAVQQQQQLFLQQQLSPVSQQQPTSRLTAAANTVVTTAAVTMTPNVVQFIPAPQPNVCPPTRTSHTVRPIQPKLPPQILPKPTTCSASNQFVSPAPNKQTPPTPVTAGQRTVGVGIQPNATGQLVIGQSQSGVFSSPPGTILLNQIIPGVGQSPILIQGNLSNLANVPGLQLTLRPPSSASPGQPLNSNSQNNATIIAALQNTSQHAHTLFAPAKSPIHGQQTIVIPNNLAHPGIPSQNINLTSAAIPNSSIMSSSSQGQSFLRSNIILPRVVGANQGQHILQHIQTPQGPILACIPSQAIAVPHLPVAPTLQNAAALGNAQLAPVTLPMHGVMTAGQGVLSGLSLQAHQPPSALQQQQSLFGAAVPFTSHVEQPSHQMIQVPQPLASPQIPTNVNQVTTNQTPSLDHSSKPSSPSKTSKAALGISSILSDILKETGIVPENSPPPSPDSNSPVIEEQVPSNLQASNAAVPPQQLITTSIQPQVLLEQVSQNLQGPGLSHMKLALAQDGSVILQPQNTFSGTQRVQSFVQSPHMQGRAISSVGSVILPTVSTCTVPVVSTESSIARSHANLIARLNSPPPVSVPDVSSLGVSSIGGCISTSITATIVTTTTNTVPITVQSLNVSSCLPIVSTGYVAPRTNVAITSDRVFYTEDAANTQNHVNAAETSITTSNVQRFNHINSGFQALVVSSESLRNSMQNTKAVQSTAMGNGSTTNSIVQAETDKSGQTHEVAENSGPSVPSLINLPPYQNVPNNQIIQVQKLQKQINELSTLKYHSPEQQKALQHSHTLLQKLVVSKSKGCRNIQNQIQKHETEVKNIVQRSQTAAQNQPIPDQMQQQINVKPPLPIQQPSENTKQQISTNSSNQSLHLVNLLKQGPSHSSPAKHSSAAVVTTCSVIISTAMSTATTNVTNTVNSTHQRIVNQVAAPAQQQRMQPVHQQKSQTENCQQPQPQVIVRMPKPQQQQSQACQNVVHLKAAAPVKKVVNTVPKTVLFNEQLNKDQNGAVCPDVNAPFRSKDDACSRLLKYHVYNTRIPSYKDMCSADETFEMVSVQLLEKKKALENKFRFLQLKDGMRPCPTPDQVLLERLFIEDEKESLKEDKTAVKEGKKLNLPPLPASWVEEVKEESPCDMPPSLTSCQSEEVTVKKEIEDNDCHSTEFSDSMREDSDPVYKDDDNLEAPVIDSCADIIVPQHDENCERSPPTLKRIVIKPEKRSESDTEEPVCNKRLKYINYDKNETNSCERNSTTTFPPKSVTHKESGKELEVKTNHKYPHVPLTRESFHSDNRIDDMVTKIRKELNMSPMEMDDDDLDTVSSHVVDFEPPSGTNDLADFEPPVARTEESCDSTLLYNNSVRTNCDVKYNYEMLGSVWDDNYVHPSNESGIAVGSIVIEHGNPSDLDLSGLDGLDHIDESEPSSIPNGIQDVGAETDNSYMAYHFPKSQKRFHEVSSVQPSSNCSSNSSQIASAIKSIMGTPSDNRSYYGAEEIQFLPGSKTGHNTHIADYGRSLDADMGVTTNNETDAVLDEAVRSILLR